MTTDNRRREARIPFLGVKLSLRGASWTQELHCLANDLSPSGLGLECGDGALAEGEAVVVEIVLPEETAPRRLNGRVAWSTRDRAGGMNRMGIEFVELPDVDRAALRRAVAQESTPPTDSLPYGCPSESRGGVLILQPGESFSAFGNDAPRRILAAAIQSTAGGIVVDLSGVPLVPSSVWGAMLAAARELLRRNRRFALACPESGAASAHKSLGLQRYLPIHVSLNDAVASVSVPG